MEGMTEHFQPDHRHVQQFQRLFVHLCRAAQGDYNQRLSEQQKSPALLEKQKDPRIASGFHPASPPLLPSPQPLLFFRPRSMETKEAQDAAVAVALQHYNQIQEKQLLAVERELKLIEKKHWLLSCQPDINRDQLKKLEVMIHSLRQMIQAMKEK